jgi:Trk-type K+ transport system membrane component
MWDTVKNFFYNLSPTRIIVGYYLLTVTFATILLSLPIARQQDVPWSFIDSLFTAVSAVSVTGLTTVSIADTFTPTGIIFLIIILQIGGIGIMAFS